MNDSKPFCQLIISLMILCFLLIGGASSSINNEGKDIASSSTDPSLAFENLDINDEYNPQLHEQYLDDAESQLRKLIRLRIAALAETRRLFDIGLIPTRQDGDGEEFASFKQMTQRLFAKLEQLKGLQAEAASNFQHLEDVREDGYKDDYTNASYARAKQHLEDVGKIGAWTENSLKHIHHRSNARLSDARARLDRHITQNEAEANALAWKYHVKVPT